MRNVAFQLAATASASITLIHESCPAGFDIVEGNFLGQYVCRCSSLDRNILSCNIGSEDILLRVRECCMHGDRMLVAIVHHTSICCTLYCFSIFLSSTHSLISTPFSLTPPPQPLCAISPSLIPCRIGCGALPSPTQMVPRSWSPQAVPVVTAAASRGTQVIRQSAGSLCLRTWPRETGSALATDKVRS